MCTAMELLGWDFSTQIHVRGSVRFLFGYFLKINFSILCFPFEEELWPTTYVALNADSKNTRDRQALAQLPNKML